MIDRASVVASAGDLLGSGWDAASERHHQRPPFIPSRACADGRATSSPLSGREGPVCRESRTHPDTRKYLYLPLALKVNAHSRSISSWSCRCLRRLLPFRCGLRAPLGSACSRSRMGRPTKKAKGVRFGLPSACPGASAHPSRRPGTRPPSRTYVPVEARPRRCAVRVAAANHRAPAGLGYRDLGVLSRARHATRPMLLGAQSEFDEARAVN